MIKPYGTPNSVGVKSMIVLGRKYPYGRIVNRFKKTFLKGYCLISLFSISNGCTEYFKNQ